MCILTLIIYVCILTLVIPFAYQDQTSSQKPLKSDSNSLMFNSWIIQWNTRCILILIHEWYNENMQLNIIGIYNETQKGKGHSIEKRTFDPLIITYVIQTPFHSISLTDKVKGFWNKNNWKGNINLLHIKPPWQIRYGSCSVFTIITNIYPRGWRFSASWDSINSNN